MEQAILIVLLLCASLLLAALAKRVNVPYPIAFVIGGVLLAFVPNLPRPRINPELLYVGVLPPLLYGAGWMTDWAEFKRNLRPIGLLAIGLVICTTVVVGVVAHAVNANLSWALAFTLGAIVAPTDTVASEAIFERLTVPRRIAAVIEGESLVNDASALVLYRFAVAAATTGVFVWSHAFAAFVWVAIAGIAIGIAMGYLIEIALRILNRRNLGDATLSNLGLLLAPFAAYLPAEAAHASGVLAAVTAGVYMSRRQEHVLDSESRIVSSGVWQVMTFLLNAMVFLLIGLQLPSILTTLSVAGRQFIVDGILVSIAVVVVRIAWVLVASYVPRAVSRRLRARDPYPSWQAIAVVSWTGMRGIVSLAAALALPYSNAQGYPLQGRAEMLFITFCVIFVTLVLQGLSLGPLVTWLDIIESGKRAKQETKLRIAALVAGIERLHELEPTFRSPREWETAGRLLAEYAQRIDHLHGHLSRLGGGEEPEATSIDHRLQREALDAERRKIVELRTIGAIPDEIYRLLEYDLDLAYVRLS
jgi:Na+/H+ antiporter